MRWSKERGCVSSPGGLHLAGVGEVSIRDRRQITQCMVIEGRRPILPPVNHRLKLLMLIPARRTERHDRRFVARDVGSGRPGVTGSSDAA